MGKSIAVRLLQARSTRPICVSVCSNCGTAAEANSASPKVDHGSRTAGVLVQRIGRFASEAILAPAAGLSNWKRLLPIVVVLALVAMTAYAYLTNWTVALLGTIFGLALVVLPALAFVLRLREPR